MDILVTKVVILIILLVSSLVIGSLPAVLVRPLQLRSHRSVLSTSQILSVLSCFGGGVFLATCLLDLLPDVRHSVDEALHFAGIEQPFPLADFIVAVGLFLILIVEQTALTYKHGHDVGIHMHHHSNDEERPLMNSASDAQRSHHHHHHHHSNHHHGSSSSHSVIHHSYGSSEEQRLGHNGTSTVPGVQNLERNIHSSYDKSVDNTCSAVQSGVEEHNALQSSHGSGAQPGYQRSSSPVNSESYSLKNRNGDDCHDLHSPSKLRSLLLLGALSLHSVFEGLALGIHNKPDEVWTLFLAVVIHKSILAFSLGVNFLKTGMGKGAMFRSLILFSLMAPVGITIGIVITEEFSTGFSHSIANGILQGLATGTFLYITFFEVLPHEINTPQNRLLKVFSIIVGFAIISVLILVFPS